MPRIKKIKKKNYRMRGADPKGHIRNMHATTYFSEADHPAALNVCV